MLTKEAVVHLSVEHFAASATDEVRVKFSVGEEENFAYELGVHIGSAMAKLFVDDPDQLAECVHGLTAYTSFSDLTDE